MFVDSWNGLGQAQYKFIEQHGAKINSQMSNHCTVNHKNVFSPKTIEWCSIHIRGQEVHSTYANILKNMYKKVRKNVGIGWIG
jgi:hypothetical protein